MNQLSSQPEPLLVAGPVIGWRLWKSEKSRDHLVSLCTDTVWKRGQTIRAQCHWGFGHPCCKEPPTLKCLCGIWAVKTPEQLDGISHWCSTSFLRSGQVKLWGRVLEYVDGYRAEYAEPVWESVQELGKSHHQMGCDIMQDSLLGTLLESAPLFP